MNTACVRRTRRFDIADDAVAILLDHHYLSERAVTAAATTALTGGLVHTHRRKQRDIRGRSEGSCHARWWRRRWSV